MTIVKHKMITKSYSLAFEFCCDKLATLWRKKEVKFNNESNEFYIFPNGLVPFYLIFCPFCGRELDVENSDKVIEVDE